MSEILVAPLEDRYLDGFHTVLSLTYFNGDPIPADRLEREKPERRAFVAVLDGEVGGVCTVLDMTATRGPALLNCGAVAGVAVLPEKRKSGIGSAMMTWLTNHLRETDTPLASLYAYREPFYRRFGYEVVGRRFKISCPTQRWPKVKSDMPVQRLTPDDWEKLVDCYNRFAHARSGLNVRTQLQWQRVLGENRRLTIYAIGDPVEAYAVISHQSQFWSTDHISEIAWSTRRGYDGLLEVLGGLAINKDGLSWFEPSDGPFYSHYLDAGIDVKVDRPIMFRVNDVPGALSQLKPDPLLDGEFVVDIEDAVVPANHGAWRVSFSGGDVQVEPATDRAWDFRLSIQAFSQVFMGQPDLVEMARHESIQVASDAGFKAASRLLPAQTTYCMDFF
ncbi:MAG: GNAT family N-acetyltransferase [Fimbriimonas sp.]|nr:GNAT family N-acetyltransferase [Fimbriimonas sp.]